MAASLATLSAGREGANVALAARRSHYNRVRPHSALGDAPPATFAEKVRLAQEAA